MGMIAVKGGICAAEGFMAAATAAKIKSKRRDDMAMIFSEKPCVVAGTFTSNVVKAAPVLWDRELVDSGRPVHAAVINSGIANACTGQMGLDICKEEADATAEAFGQVISADSVLLASTGIIGLQLPIEKMKNAISEMVPKLEASEAAATAASKAIMTTDTTNKEFALEFTIGGKKVHLGGMTKGSGMIHPQMCTMICFLTTDLSITKELLQKALSENVVDTFNMISVDGDTSTNDTFLVMANGMAENPEIKEGTPEYEEFKAALHYINESLAKMMAGDGEGATALFETKVIGADTKEHARILSKSVICSSLTKAAIYGHDANWGRILCALGYSGVQFDPEKIELFFESKSGRIQIYKDGVATDYSEEEASKILADPEVTVLVDMKMGNETATAWGCDLTYDYVKINADYRS